MSAHETTATLEDVERAKAQRAERDRQSGNAFPVEDPDYRWIGDLGEFVFARWLRAHGLEGGDGGGLDLAPDFPVNGRAVALKTGRAGRDASAGQRHAERPGVDFLAFADYALESRRWRMLGALTPGAFIRAARLHPPKTPDGRAYFRLEVEFLWGPDVLLAALRLSAAA